MNFVSDTIRQFSSATHQMKQLTIPLIQQGIFHFSMIRSYDDGRFVNLSNIDGWIDYYYEQKLYLSSCFENHPSAYFSQIFLWGTQLNGKVVDDAKQKFDSSHGITVIKRELQYTDFYFFSSSLEKIYLNNFYINNLAFLYQFIHRFEKEATHLINPFISDKRAYIYENLYITNSIPGNINETDKVDLHQLITADECPVNITPRESDCLYWLLKGCSAKEIAKVKCLSPRTIEQHVDSLKKKFGCKTSLELVSNLFHEHHNFSLSLLHKNNEQTVGRKNL
jgi:DNA-binding CsgD family transcriptional regulator